MAAANATRWRAAFDFEATFPDKQGRRIAAHTTVWILRLRSIFRPYRLLCLPINCAHGGVCCRKDERIDSPLAHASCGVEWTVRCALVALSNRPVICRILGAAGLCCNSTRGSELSER